MQARLRDCHEVDLVLQHELVELGHFGCGQAMLIDQSPVTIPRAGLHTQSGSRVAMGCMLAPIGLLTRGIVGLGLGVVDQSPGSPIAVPIQAGEVVAVKYMRRCVVRKMI